MHAIAEHVGGRSDGREGPLTDRRDTSVAGRAVVVIGAARSGVAAAELLASRGARVTVTDVKTALDDSERLRGLGVILELGAHRTETLTSADLIVVSPGVPLHQPALDAARASGVQVIGELELAWRWLRGRVIAITGTKGKSTTTTLTGRMLQAAGFDVLVGGNIGTPLSAQVERSTARTLHVVEASSFQLEATDTFHPWIAALLNVSPDHLDQHASVEAYAAAKGRIFARQTAQDWAVVNADDDAAVSLASGSVAQRVAYGLSAADTRFTVSGDAVVERVDGADAPLVPLASVRVPGRHILSDIVAAAAISRTAGAPAAALRGAVEAFRGLEHAMELVGEIDGVRFVNDSKATNIESAKRSIESVAAGLVVILGGRYKGGDFGDLAEALRSRGASVMAIGEAAPRIEAALGHIVPVERADGMADAVRRGFSKASPGGAVVLAPACSSFDMFRDYAERGQVFREEVQRLAATRRATREQ